MHAKQEEAIALVHRTPGAGAGVKERSLEVPREVLVKEESEDAAAGERLVKPNESVHRERSRRVGETCWPMNREEETCLCCE